MAVVVDVNVRDIIAEYLREHGYDGLWTDIDGCGCWAKDLMPCCSWTGACQPGIEATDEDGEPIIGPPPVQS